MGEAQALQLPPHHCILKWGGHCVVIAGVGARGQQPGNPGPEAMEREKQIGTQQEDGKKGESVKRGKNRLLSV